MPISASNLRSNIYQLLDEVLKTGKPLRVKRRDGELEIVPVRRAAKLDALVPHEGCLTGDPETIVHLDWSGEWNDDLS